MFVDFGFGVLNEFTMVDPYQMAIFLALLSCRTEEKCCWNVLPSDWHQRSLDGLRSIGRRPAANR